MNLVQHIKQNSLARKTAICMSAVTLSAVVATGALAAGGRSGGHGGHMRNGMSPPLLDQVPGMPPPILNPSYPYTIPQSPEVPVSPASPGSIFGNGPTRP
jgi:hypothetical protein